MFAMLKMKIEAMSLITMAALAGAPISISISTPKTFAQARSIAPATTAGPGAAAPNQDTAPDTRTEKQKALAAQAERLFAMATELKAQVDVTNKNILSLKVVQKAEEIEALAKGMRGQVKK